MLVSGYSGSSPFAMVHALPRTAGLVPANRLGWIEQRPGKKLSARAMASRLVEAVDSYYNDFSVHLKEPGHLPVFFFIPRYRGSRRFICAFVAAGKAPLSRYIPTLLFLISTGPLIQLSQLVQCVTAACDDHRHLSSAPTCISYPHIHIYAQNSTASFV